MARPQCGRSDLASQLCGPRSKDRARNIANLISCNISVAPDWLPAAQICPQKQSSAQTPRTMCGHAVGHTRICQMFVFAHQRGGRDFSNHISAVQPPIGCPKKRQVRICIKGWRAGLGTGEIAVGDLAALVAMGGTAPSRYALRHDQLLDGLVFAAKGTAVTDVCSAGRYMVKSGHIRYAI